MRNSHAVRQLIQEHRRGYSLAQPFYVDPQIFDIEVERFLGPQWLLVGHVSEIPEHGDYFVVTAFGASVIVVRCADGAISALHNVCRHRGAKICEEARGRTSLFRCRYHGWSYRLDGGLAAWRHMPDELNKNDYALRQCGVATFEGLIFISLDRDNAPDSDSMFRPVRPYWARYDLGNCKVVATREYRVHANWKLGIENNLECYHCLPCHPEYTAGNAFVRADEKVSESVVAAFSTYQQSWAEKMRKNGNTAGRSDFVVTRGQMCRAGAFPLAPGRVTGSRDGKGIAPLLGSITAYDESITTGCFGFLSYVGAMCDYAFVATYVPQTVETTLVVFKWLVNASAVEGKDYDVDELCWLWDQTTQQDKSIIELNAAGVRSRGYVPGPYSKLEGLTRDFTERYLDLMASPE